MNGNSAIEATTTVATMEAEVCRLVSVIDTNLEQPSFVPQLYRLLADGEPVTAERLAATADLNVDQVRGELASHAGTDWDAQGRIVGFGLTLRPTPHTFTFDDRTVYAFCAGDALQLPVVLGRSGVVESPCPATGERVRVEVTPNEVIGVDPSQSVVSKVRPTEAVTDVRGEICGLGHFFSSPEAAAEWLAQYPQGQVDPVVDEFGITRRAMIELGWAADGGRSHDTSAETGLDEDAVRLARGKNLATVVTVMPGGQLQALPTWIDTDGEYLLVNTEPQRQRVKNVNRDPRITVLIQSGEDPWDWAEVRGRVVATVTGEPARRHIDELSHRYAGTDVPECRVGPKGRVVLKIAADKVTTPARYFARGR